MKQITLLTALKRCKAMWQWLANERYNHVRSKQEFTERHNAWGHPVHYCWFCAYANFTDHCFLAAGDCRSCPGVKGGLWPLHRGTEKFYGCKHTGSPYVQWKTGSFKERISAAKQIADFCAQQIKQIEKRQRTKRNKKRKVSK